MYCIMWASVPSLYNVYRRYDYNNTGSLMLDGVNAYFYLFIADNKVNLTSHAQV